MSQIKAIETVYKGYRFRSRLEARWAVFFDTLGVKWEYEKEGYDLDGTWYLPDFWLPEQECWIEIKGQNPSLEEGKKAGLLACGSKKPVFILYGTLEPHWQEHKEINVDEFDLIQHGALSDAFTYKEDIQDAYWSDTFHFFTECPDCHRIEITFWGYTKSLSCNCHGQRTQKLSEYFRWSETLPETIKASQYCKDALGEERYEQMDREFYQQLGERDSNHNSPRLIAAYTAARQARFEHGEKP